jgi:hypothetical protein
LLKRQQIIDAVVAELEPLPWAQAAWLGGSDASGRTDDWSDIDLMLVVDDDRKEDAFVALRTALARLSPVAYSWRLPEPTWHGHAQEFLQLRDADPCHFIDVVVLLGSHGDRLLEPERHGEALVLFDRAAIVTPAPFDRAAHAAKMARRLAELRQTFFLFQNLTTKAVRREDVPDAVQCFQAFTIRPLVELLRMRHCPDRYDFGLRYLDRDLPAELGAEIRLLVLPRTLTELEAFRERAETIFRSEILALDTGEWSLPR